MGKAICYRSQAWIDKNGESDSTVVYDRVAAILNVPKQRLVKILAPAKGDAIQAAIAIVNLDDFSRVDYVED